MNKVILLAPTPPPAGGIAGWTMRMLEAKLKNNWEIILVDEKVIGSREVFGDNVRKNIFWETKRCFKIWHSLNIALSDKKAKVVHSCIPSSTMSMLREYVCALITKARRRKFIVHFRCTVPNTTKGSISRFVLKQFCKKCDGIIVLNEVSLKYIESIANCDLFLIPNFISKSELEDEHVINDELTNVLYVGGVIEEKGCDDIISIAQKHPNKMFRLVGNASKEIVRLAHNIPNVTLVGNLNKEEVKRELRTADAFMFLSRFYGEGFSNALCEAMAAGLPCIVTDWAANADMINEYGGFVVKINDLDETSKRLSMMEDKIIRSKMSKYNIAKVKKNYIESIVIDQYVDVYEKILHM